MRATVIEIASKISRQSVMSAGLLTANRALLFRIGDHVKTNVVQQRKKNLSYQLLFSRSPVLLMGGLVLCNCHSRTPLACCTSYVPRPLPLEVGIL